MLGWTICARPWRASRSGSSATCGQSILTLQVRFEFPPDKFVELLHAVFHRRLIRPELVATALPQRAPARFHPFADLVVFGGGFQVGGLFGIDELALEQGNLLRVVELNDVGCPV